MDSVFTRSRAPSPYVSPPPRPPLSTVDLGLNTPSSSYPHIVTRFQPSNPAPPSPKVIQKPPSPTFFHDEAEIEDEGEDGSEQDEDEDEVEEDDDDDIYGLSASAHTNSPRPSTSADSGSEYAPESSSPPSNPHAVATRTPSGLRNNIRPRLSSDATSRFSSPELPLSRVCIRPDVRFSSSGSDPDSGRPLVERYPRRSRRVLAEPDNDPGTMSIEQETDEDEAEIEDLLGRK